MPPSYSMGERWTITMKMELRRRRLFMLFSYFSCYKKGQWNSGVWNRYLSGESESPAGRAESPDLASPLTGWATFGVLSASQPHGFRIWKTRRCKEIGCFQPSSHEVQKSSLKWNTSFLLPAVRRLPLPLSLSLFIAVPPYCSKMACFTLVCPLCGTSAEKRWNRSLPQWCDLGGSVCLGGRLKQFLSPTVTPLPKHLPLIISFSLR